MRECFVATPFDSNKTGDFSRLYEEEIRPAIERAGFKPVRADDSFVARPIFDDIRECIRKADIVLAEISSSNPNVFAEVGMALGMDKPVTYAFDRDIIERPPFDIQHFRGIGYRRTSRTYLDKFQKDIERTLIETLSFYMERQASVEFAKDASKSKTEERLRIIKMLSFDQMFEPLDPKDGVRQQSLVEYLTGLPKYEFRKAEITSAIQKLIKDKWVESFQVEEEDRYNRWSVPCLRLSDQGVDWVLNRPKFHDDVREVLRNLQK